MNVVYFQSGGPTAVINSSFYGVIKKYQESKEIDALYYSHFGLNGLIDDDLEIVDKNKDYSFLTKLPGAFCGTARIKLSETYDNTYKKILNTLNKYHISVVLVNGGNDSMDTANKLSKYFKDNNINIKVFGIPKTIDNDLNNCFVVPGFISAMNVVVNSVIDISYDVKSYKKGRVTIIETMGRDAGWLAASSCLASDCGEGPDLIYVSEVPFSIEKFLDDVKKVYEKQNRVLVVLSEMLCDENGNFVFSSEKIDRFGHVQLGSISRYLCDIIEDKLKINTRHIELNLLQRCVRSMISPLDVKIATKCGYIALNSALNNKENGCISIKYENDKFDYYLDSFDNVANLIKQMPKTYITKEGNNITKEGKLYFKTLLSNKID